MNIFRRTALMGVLLLLTACLPVVGSFPHPKITSVEVHKADRQLTLLSYGFVIRRYDIDLGSDPVGPKRQRGDG
ncbi:MAG: hypothetical protein P8L32_01135, partial [Paracoccaceae bacterium]|nr:hypothetical protein [Paracoccaceae bacterium]